VGVRDAKELAQRRRSEHRRGGRVDQKLRIARKQPRPKAAPRKTEDGSAFDSWLETKLRSAYSSVLDEPIPDDLIQLLTQKLKD
jgi:hypothetical protein